MPDSSLLIEYVGFIAAILTAITLIPQALQIWKSNNFACISVPVYTLLMSSAAMWLLYGLLIQKWPLIVSNLISMVLAGAILILKYRWKKTLKHDPFDFS